MKIFSINQPWAWLVISGIKNVENRAWKTSYRGLLHIHASKEWDDFFKGKYNGFTLDQWNSLDLQVQERLTYRSKNDFLTSAIIGEVVLVDCVRWYNSVWAEKNTWNWILSDPVMYETPVFGVNGLSR